MEQKNKKKISTQTIILPSKSEKSCQLENILSFLLIPFEEGKNR